tara:strand:- start:836 stop:1615 length:780 start_codon:yes stop_codon:yes gene_type:complete
VDSNLDISIFQIDLAFKDKEQNLNLIDNLSEKILSSDILLLPEMFNTSFITNDISIAEKMDGPTVQWMKNLARKKNATVVGTILVQEEELFFNRLLWVNKNGDIQYYDKCHLFSLANEDKLITKGKNKIVINEKGWNICPLICYDLRFPVFCRNQDDYDVLIFLSSWPEKRIDAWDALLKARSIENQCVTIGVNRVGKDPAGFLFPGHSLVFDSLGNELLDMQGKKNTVQQVVLSKEKLDLERRQLKFLNDRDGFTIYQ